MADAVVVAKFAAPTSGTTVDYRVSGMEGTPAAYEVYVVNATADRDDSSANELADAIRTEGGGNGTNEFYVAHYQEDNVTPNVGRAAGTVASARMLDTSGTTDLMLIFDSFLADAGSGAGIRFGIPLEGTGATLGADGSGYAANDELVIVGGTFNYAATFNVDSVDGGGAVVTFSLKLPGAYTAAPSNPAATTTDGGGSGCTLNLTTTARTASADFSVVVKFYLIGTWDCGTHTTSSSIDGTVEESLAFDPETVKTWGIMRAFDNEVAFHAIINRGISNLQPGGGTFQGHVAWRSSSVANASLAVRARNDSGYGEITLSGANQRTEIELGTGKFTSTTKNVAKATIFAYLACNWEGRVESHAEVITQKTTAGVESYENPGRKSQAVTFLTSGARTINTRYTNNSANNCGIGLVTDTEEHAQMTVDEDGTSPTDTASSWSTRAIRINFAVGAETYAVDYDSRDSLGYNLDFVTTNSTARSWIAHAVSWGVEKELTGRGLGRGLGRARLTIPLDLGSGRSLGRAIGVGTIGRLRLLSGVALGRGLGVASLIRSRLLSGVSLGRALGRGAIIRSRLLSGVALGRALGRGTLGRLRGLTGRALGRALGAASLKTTMDLGVARSLGRALGVGTLGRLRNVTGRGMGRGLARGALGVLRGLSGVALGRSSLRGALGRLRSLTGRGLGRALGRSVLSRTLDLGVARSLGRALGAAALTFDDIMELARGLGRSISRAFLDTVRTCTTDPTDLEADLIPATLEILQSLGRSMVLVERTPTYDEVEGETTFAETLHTVTTSPPLAFHEGFAAGDSRVSDATLVYVAASGIGAEPSLVDLLRFDGFDWTILKVDPILAGEAVAAYRILVTGGSLSANTAAATELVTATLEILTSLGRPITVVERVPTYDEVEGETTFVETTHTVQGSPPLRNAELYAPGDSRVRGSSLVYLAAKGATVEPGLVDLLRFDGLDWTILRVDPIFDQDALAAWAVFIEGGRIPASTTAITELDGVDSLYGVAKDLIDELGKTYKFVVHTYQFYDETEGETTEAGFCDFCRKATPPEPYSRHLVNDDTIRADDLRIFVAERNLGFVPYRDLRVIDVDTGEVFSTISVEPIYTGGKIALYGLQLRT